MAKVSSIFGPSGNASCLCGLACIAMLGTASSAAAQDQDCKTELAEFRAIVIAASEKEPGMRIMLGQLDIAEEYCDKGNLERYRAWSGTTRKRLPELKAMAAKAEPAADDDEPEDADKDSGTPDIDTLAGVWCYAHEGGERAEYHITPDGTYSLRPSEFRWQEMQTGPVEDMFRNMRIIEKHQNMFRVEIGAYEAEFVRGACEK